MAHAYRLPQEGPLPDLRLYERLIADGVAEADARGSIVDHVTARRLAIWLAARPQPKPLARGLVRFIETGAVSPALKTELRRYVRAEPRSYQSQAARLLQYCAGRNDQLAPAGQDFGRTCDQIDRADAMLAGLRERARQGLRPAEQAWPEVDGPQAIALARQDRRTGMVTLVVDATTAGIAMFAIAAHAEEREAHLREIERAAQSLPDGSYGRRNRQVIAARETRIAGRLRAVEQACRAAIDRDAAPSVPGLDGILRPPEHADADIELE